MPDLAALEAQEQELLAVSLVSSLLLLLVDMMLVEEAAEELTKQDEEEPSLPWHPQLPIMKIQSKCCLVQGCGFRVLVL